MIFSINDTQYNSTLLNVIFFYCYAECRDAECCYAECHYDYIVNDVDATKSSS